MTARQWIAPVIALLATLQASAAKPGDDPHFDCTDAFDLIALTTTLQCETATAESPPAKGLAATAERLVADGIATNTEVAGLEIRWCDLTSAMGFTPSARQIYLDTGLAAGTQDLIAEVLAHEIVHTRQFERLGEAGFKCAYVKAFVECFVGADGRPDARRADPREGPERGPPRAGGRRAARG